MTQLVRALGNNQSRSAAYPPQEVAGYDQRSLRGLMSLSGCPRVTAIDKLKFKTGN
jgi:hypothetical protein